MKTEYSISESNLEKLAKELVTNIEINYTRKDGTKDSFVFAVKPKYALPVKSSAICMLNE